jgi:hypothetical protein
VRPESSRKRIRFEAPPFFDRPLSEPEQKWRDVEIARLVDFFLIRRNFSCGIGWESTCHAIVKKWKIARRSALHSLDRYSIEQQLLDDALDGVGPESALASVRALGVLPPGWDGWTNF